MVTHPSTNRVCDYFYYYTAATTTKQVWSPLTSPAWKQNRPISKKRKLVRKEGIKYIRKAVINDLYSAGSRLLYSHGVHMGHALNGQCIYMKSFYECSSNTWLGTTITEFIVAMQL